jgi:hypothetical protein
VEELSHFVPADSRRPIGVNHVENIIEHVLVECHSGDVQLNGFLNELFALVVLQSVVFVCVVFLKDGLRGVVNVLLSLLLLFSFLNFFFILEVVELDGLFVSSDNFGFIDLHDVVDTVLEGGFDSDMWADHG